jgi:putative DNA primase/helicase
VLVGKLLEQILVIFWGSGANGKTTLVKTLLRVLGEGYVQQAAMAMFLAKRRDGIPNDIARLAGARLVVAAESANSRRLDESMVKQLTGGDNVTARFLHAEYFSFEPTFTVILSTNHRPDIRGSNSRDLAPRTPCPVHRHHS